MLVSAQVSHRTLSFSAAAACARRGVLITVISQKPHGDTLTNQEAMVLLLCRRRRGAPKKNQMAAFASSCSTSCYDWPAVALMGCFFVVVVVAIFILNQMEKILRY